MSSIYDEMCTVPPRVQEVLDLGEQIRALLYKYKAESEAREVEMLKSMTEAVEQATKELKEARKKFFGEVNEGRPEELGS